MDLAQRQIPLPKLSHASLKIVVIAGVLLSVFSPRLMHHTIFDTPVVNTLLRVLSVTFLRLRGWKVVGKLPANASKSVLIAAPHTSNWDLPYTLRVCFALRLNVYWMGKSSIFKPPFRGVMMWLGGIAVDRSQSNNLVEDSSAAIRRASGPLQLIVPPEGTRSGTRYWKTGFYYIAAGAGVPIVMAYLDYEKKIGGLGPVFQTTRDIDADMLAIKAFYAGVKGKNPDQFRVD
jgi:1-acyl-sn-glycerol-3-phosphate acyltransferase